MFPGLSQVPLLVFVLEPNHILKAPTEAMSKTDEINEVAALAVDQIELVKDHMNYELVDKEVAQYANEVIVEIDDETNKRLKKLIDKRIMAVMIVTYLIQTLDKGTMSYASIMGIQTDLHLHGQQVSSVGNNSLRGNEQ